MDQETKTSGRYSRPSIDYAVNISFVLKIPPEDHKGDIDGALNNLKELFLKSQYVDPNTLCIAIVKQ